MNILVLCPMHVEKKNFEDALSSYIKSQGGKINNTYKVVEVGVGKVEAASNATLEVNGYLSKEYDLVALIGYAGATLNYELGSLVVPSQARYSDAKVPQDLPGLEHLTKFYDLEGYDNCTILTSDSFVTKDNFAQVITYNSNDSQGALFDMESAAVAQVLQSSVNPTPLMVLKMVSDHPTDTYNSTPFNEFVATHSNFQSMVILLELL